jgi:eukaryotic-like serine/threonine-protein kinase
VSTAVSLGRSREGIAILDTVLEENERLFGADHPASLETLSCLANAYRVVGQWDKAIMFAKRVLEKRESTLGPVHPATVGAMHMLAMCFGEASFFGESLAWHEKTLAICDATQASNLWQLRTYARALQGAGRLEEADRQLRKALELSGKQSDRRERELQVAGVQTILGLNLLLQQRFEEAERVARGDLAVLEKERPDHWSHFHAMSLVGGALLGQQKYAAAESYLVQGYEGMKQRELLMDAGFRGWLDMAGKRAVRFFEETNQPDKAREWREKLPLPARPK